MLFTADAHRDDGKRYSSFRVFDAAGNVIETHEHTGDFKDRYSEGITMKTNARTKPIAIEETARTFEGDIANADALRASALTGLQRLRAAKANHIQREQTRLAGELGEEHPDVVRLKVELGGDQRFVRELGAEIDRAKTEAPVVDKQSWALHGFVRNEDLEGQPKLTLALFDRSGSWVEVWVIAARIAAAIFNCDMRDPPRAGPMRSRPMSVPKCSFTCRIKSRKSCTTTNVP